MSLATGSSPHSGTMDRDRLLQQAKLGEAERIGELLESYRNYLSILAATQVDQKLKAKVSASDLVQETMMGAFRDFSQFRGTCEQQLLGWLRQILIHQLHVFVRRNVLAAKRDVRREIPLAELGAALARSTVNLQVGMVLADQQPSPSSNVIRRENAVMLADVLSQMPEDYRNVILLRNLRGLSFEEVAAEMERTAGAVRMLWLRAIAMLKKRMHVDDSKSEQGESP